MSVSVTLCPQEPHRDSARRGRQCGGRFQPGKEPLPDDAAHRHEPPGGDGAEYVRQTPGERGQAGHRAVGAL